MHITITIYVYMCVSAYVFVVLVQRMAVVFRTVLIFILLCHSQMVSLKNSYLCVAPRVNSWLGMGDNKNFMSRYIIRVIITIIDIIMISRT